MKNSFVIASWYTLSPSVTTAYRNIKYPRLEFKTGNLQLILPKHYEKEKQLVEKHSKWINNKQQAIQKALNQAKTKQLNQTRTITELKALVNHLAQQHQTELNTTINKTFYRKMKTKWASISQNRNLTINTLTRRLPENLIAYITYHELTHAKHGRKHNAHFGHMICRKFPEHQMHEEHLLTYWFLIQKTTAEKTASQTIK